MNSLGTCTSLNYPQYYAHREKLRLIGREADLEKMNRQALKIAREVADETGTLMAGNICNSTIYRSGHKATEEKVYRIFEVMLPSLNHYMRFSI